MQPHKNTPKKYRKTPDRPSIAIASVPDRALSLLGKYVKLKKAFRVGGQVVAKAGDTGVIVRDSRGKCKAGQVAVKFPGFFDTEYQAVPERLLNLPRRE